MKAIATRIRRLEARLALQEDLGSWRLANLIYDRRRRRAEAARDPFDDPPPVLQISGPRLSIAETLRLGRQRAYERNQRLLASRSAAE